MARKLVFIGYDTAGFVQSLTVSVQRSRFKNLTFSALQFRTRSYNPFLTRLKNLFSFLHSLFGCRKRFILLGDCGILGNKNYSAEVILCRILNHEIFILNQGSQTRLPCISLLYEYRKKTNTKVERIAKYCSLGATYIDTRQTAYMHIKEFLDFEYIKLPWPREAISSFDLAKDKHYRDAVVHIAHAPSRRLGKGTSFVRSLISCLKSDGFNISYKELHGLSNESVMHVFADAHIVIDQVFNDVPIARVGLEAISSGCVYVQSSPVVHIDDNRRYFGASTVSPDDMYSHVSALVLDREYRLSTLKNQYQMIGVHDNIDVFTRLASPFPSGAFIQPGSCLAVPWGLPASTLSSKQYQNFCYLSLDILPQEYQSVISQSLGKLFGNFQ